MKEKISDFNRISLRRQKTVSEEIGKKYGMLKIESFAYIQGTDTYFNCICDCGKHTVKRISFLKSGHTTSCGCKTRKEKHDLTGQTFGYWTVLGRDEYHEEGIYYLCRCVCGRESRIGKKKLIYGKTKSCGCKMSENRKDTLISEGKMTSNAVFNDLTGQRFGRLTVIERGEPPKDREGNKRKYVYWKCRCDCGNEKTLLTSHLTSGAVISCGCYQKEMYQIMGETKGMQLGAVDGTNVKSIRNALAGNTTKSNKSGVRGVLCVNGGYRARIGFKGEEIYLGTYKTIERAAQARKSAEQILYGKWLDEFEETMSEEYKKEYSDAYKRIMIKLKKLRETEIGTQEDPLAVSNLKRMTFGDENGVERLV